MTGDTKRGDAVADRWRDTFDKNRRETDLALTRLEVRAEQRSADFEEDSVVIHKEAAERVAQRDDSLPERAAGGVRTVLDGVNSWHKVAALFLLCAVAAFVAWLKWR
jgi:hypothetical protein